MIRLRTRIQTRAALLASASLVAFSLVGYTVSAAPSYSPDNQESAFLGLINDYRAQNGLGPLVLQDELGSAADFHSQDMADHNYFDHYLSDGSGPGDNIAAHGYTGETWGENIAAGMATASEALDGWINIPSHNAAMLDPDYTEIGIGRYYNADSKYGWYWTTDFGGGEDGSPSSSSIGQTTTNVDTSTRDGNSGNGSNNAGTVTTTVNGRPVRGGNIVNADGKIITTVNTSDGAAPIERTTTIAENPSVSNGADWVAPSNIYQDSYSDTTDSYGNPDTAPADSYDSYSDGETISGGDDSYTSADDSYSSGNDSYADTNADDSYSGSEDTAADDSYSGSEDTYAAAEDSYSGDSYGAEDSYSTFNAYQSTQTIEAQQDGVINPPTINGVPVESGTYVDDASTYGNGGRNRTNTANGNGPTVVYGDINGDNAPTSIN
ncbi:MAG: CAP domain-containing protein, partial [Thermomicrobiales bacterium]